MSYGISERCVCGHRFSEHSMFGVCHGCTECGADDAHDADDHPYEQCECREFKMVREIA